MAFHYGAYVLGIIIALIVVVFIDDSDYLLLAQVKYV